MTTEDPNWHFDQRFQALAHLFGSLQAVFELQGEHITGDRISEVIRVEHLGVRYYVKRYSFAGKGLRRLFGRSRIQSEWENLQWFTRHQLPTATLVGYGQEKKWGLFQRGALITQEIPNTHDLDALARAGDPRLSDRHWVSDVSQQVADAMRTMHAHGFIHGDFKWRNLLVDDNARLFLIDCPLGRIWHGSLFAHRVIKEFSSLDRVAKYTLSNTQRLRFYLQYVQKTRLDASDKRFLRKLAQRKNNRASSFGQFIQSQQQG